jgi:serine/threonine protein kinase
MNTNTSYIPVHTTNRSECQKIHSYVLRKQLGKGAYGTVYEACTTNQSEDCHYVLKVIHYDHEKYKQFKLEKHSIEHIHVAWDHEVQIHDALMECQSTTSFKFVPRLYDAWFCDLFEEGQNSKDIYYYMLMEKYDGNLTDFIKLFAKSNIPSMENLLRYTLRHTLSDLKTSLGLIHHKCNICIKDIKLDNILYKMTPTSLEFAYTDFGLSEKIDCKKQDEEKLDRDIEFFLSNFQSLL